jgi:hypothetical protein
LILDRAEGEGIAGLEKDVDRGDGAYRRESFRCGAAGVLPLRFKEDE